MTSSNGNIFRVTGHLCGEFTDPRWIRFDVFFDLRLNKRLSKQSWGWWFETLSCPLWRQWGYVCGHFLCSCSHVNAIELRWWFDDELTLVQPMAACRQATGHCLTSANVGPDLCRHMASLGHSELVIHVVTRFLLVCHSTHCIPPICSDPWTVNCWVSCIRSPQSEASTFSGLCWNLPPYIRDFLDNAERTCWRHWFVVSCLHRWYDGFCEQL